MRLTGRNRRATKCPAQQGAAFSGCLLASRGEDAVSRSQPAAEFREAPARVQWSAPSDADPNHHLWLNGRVWWIAFTVHQGHRQERIRLSLGTRDVAEARRRRDAWLDLFAHAEDLRISLRFVPPRRDRARGAAPCEVA